MEKGYYWAKWKFEDGTLGEWEIIEVESENFICRLGDDEVWDTSNFKFGDRILDIKDIK